MVSWLALGVTNCVILGMRNTPLAAIDFGLALSCFGIITVYLNVFEIILIAAALLLTLAVLIKLFRSTRPLAKPAFSRLRGTVSCITAAAATAAVLLLSLRTQALETTFSDLPGAYRDYGFVYCFSLSVLDRGVDRPADYSESGIKDILATIETEQVKQDAPAETNDPSVSPDTGTENTTVKPNIIFIQLESFFDVNRLNNITFSENPVPVFTSLKENASSGFLTVPSIGAGTANTEFEVLTGMNLDDFGAGEYPYKTILRTQTCESLPYNLQTLGYTCHAVHNNSATFYDRNKVYASLGFDTFLPLEYMQNVIYNPLGWAKDAVLTDEIMKCLNSTTGADFVFAVSVQPHGKYPDDEIQAENEDAYDTVSLLDRIFGETDDNESVKGGNLTGNVTQTLTEDELDAMRIEVSGIEDERLAAQYRYYVNQLYETDAFIGDLIEELTASAEPTVLVLYGDHLPCFNYTNDDMADGSTPFETEYVIWDNIGLEQADKDLQSFQLAAEVLNRLDIHEGIITRLHQNCSSDTDYFSSLQMLEYDMLYGQMEAWGGINPYLPTILKMGVDQIRVTDIRFIETSLYVAGENFTAFSSVSINNRTYETIYIDTNTLLVSDFIPKEGDRISVIQTGSDGVVLGESNAVYVKP
ncbi:MAG: LTA synthase family protein [Eubacteriales bacterium]